MLAIPARVIATCFALACFAGSVVVGIYHQNPALSILLSGLLVLVAAYVVGLIVGAIAQHAVDDHIRKHKKQHPIPGEAADDDDTVAAAPPG